MWLWSVTLLVLCATAGKLLTCTAKVTNTGNVRLSNVAFGGDTNCSMSAGGLLSPASSTTCTFSKVSQQSDFEAGSINWTVSASAAPLGTNTSLVPGSAQGSIQLDIQPVLSVSLLRIENNGSTAVTAEQVVQAGSVVTLAVTATNDGNVHLHNISLAVPGLTKQLSCNNSLALLPVRGKLECTGSFLFDQDALEAGNRAFTATGISNAASKLVNTTSPAVTVEVRAFPRLWLDVDAYNCTKPNRMRK